MITHLMCKG